ncbi:MAG TPA: alpha/beta fold hydrolase, partial [Chloroflexota bacterium]|nr:alpha/beta fold hydrolase [Chloroflexota bacterium]
MLAASAQDAVFAPSARHSRRRWAARAAVASGGLLSASMAVALYVVEQLTRASQAVNTYGFSPFEIGVPWEDIRIPTVHDDTLAGWWFTRAESTQVVICCHGYRGNKADLLGVGAGLWRQGYHAVLFDYRGHGEHVGTRVTLGYRELEDALAAVNYVHARMPQAEIGLIGYSMGASVAIMAAARDQRIRAVVADSPFAAQRNPVKRRMKQTLHAGWSGDPILFLADQLLHWRAGYHFRDVEPWREIGHIAPRPLLLVHGLADLVIDAADSQLLYEAAGEPKELWLVPGVGHCGAYF